MHGKQFKTMKSTLVGLVLILVISNYTSAQNTYGRREAEKDVEKKYEGDRQKGVNAVDERLDKWEENDKVKRAKIEPFPAMSMSMTIEYPEKPKNNMTVDYYFKNYECAAIFTSQKTNGSMDRMIMNFKDGKSTMLMTDKKGRKTGMVMEMKNYDWAIKNAVDKNNKKVENGDASITATDEYKTIEGYKCRKYLFEDQNNKMDLWVCKDVGMDYLKFNRAAGSAFSNSKTPGGDAYRKAGIDGVVIQTHIYPKGGRNEEAIMTTKNIKTGNIPEEMFSTAGYEVTTMPSLKDMWKSANEEK